MKHREGKGEAGEMGASEKPSQRELGYCASEAETTTRPPEKSQRKKEQKSTSKLCQTQVLVGGQQNRLEVEGAT